jgi:hypothetical protein
MKSVGVDDCLIPCWHLLKKLVEIGVRNSIPSGYNSLSELIVALKAIIMALLNPILHPFQTISIGFKSDENVG